MSNRRVERNRREAIVSAARQGEPEEGLEMPNPLSTPIGSHLFAAIPVQPAQLSSAPTRAVQSPSAPTEQEADAVADQVVQTASSPAPERAAPERPLLSLPAATSIAPGGAPLDSQTQSIMEPKFGVDFSSVRVHENPKAAQALDAQAFTVGRDIVFDAGNYSSGTPDGQRLLAHELAHVVQDPGGRAVHRKPAKGSGAGANVRERVVEQRQAAERHRTVAKIRIVGHASPRWRTARSPKVADENNWKLAEQRADKTRAEVAALLARLMPGRDLVFEYEYRRSSEVESKEPVKALDEPSDVTIDVETRGSTETMAEAGDRGRRANDDPMRRVDVTVTLHSETETDVETDVERTETKPGATTDWSIWVAGEAGVEYVAKAGGILVQLQNGKTGQKGLFAGYTIGGGASIGVNVAKTSPPSFESFTTPEPMTFQDFSGATFKILSFGAGVGAFGAEWSRFKFDRFVGGQKTPGSIQVGGFSFGGIELNILSSVEGTMWLTDSPAETYDETTMRTDLSTFESLEQTNSAHRVLFETSVADVDSWQSDLLNEYLMGVIARSGL